MSDRKLKLGWFTVPDWKKEEAWLRRQHMNGWEFVHYTPPCFYTFKRCKPEDVIYQLDYNEEGLRQKAEYIQMFQDCGWEYITDATGYSYFRKPASQMKKPEEIFCDDQSRLDMIHRVFRGRMIPLLVLFFSIVVPQLFFTHHRAESVGWLKWLFYAYVIFFVFYLAIFIKFAVSYWKLRDSVKQ